MIDLYFSFSWTNSSAKHDGDVFVQFFLYNNLFPPDVVEEEEEEWPVCEGGYLQRDIEKERARISAKCIDN